MKCNLEFYRKGIPLSAYKGWKLHLLSTPYNEVTLDNYKKYLRYKVVSGEFDVEWSAKNGQIAMTKPLEMDCDFKRYTRWVRSAVVEVPNGVTMVLSVGDVYQYGDEDLKLASTRLIGSLGNTLSLMDFTLGIEAGMEGVLDPTRAVE